MNSPLGACGQKTRFAGWAALRIGVRRCGGRRPLAANLLAEGGGRRPLAANLLAEALASSQTLHAQLHAPALRVDFEDAHLHHLADGHDGERVFDEAVGQF
jgi:hypothetical protein